jgi:RNA polymerase sigma factor (sigma-70 family)
MPESKRRGYFISKAGLCQGFIENRRIWLLFHAQKPICGIFFGILCNIMACGAIISMAMVGAMAKTFKQTGADDIVVRARNEADALSQLYELYYERIFRFCVHRLFNKETAEDVTSMVFLEVARRIRSFEGRTEQDFRNWLYAIAANQANAYIRKTARRKRLLAEAVDSMTDVMTGNISEPDWPRLYAAILKLKPEHQTIITLRFFENMEYEQIANILDAREATLRVTLHRILGKLRKHLETVFEGEL